LESYQIRMIRPFRLSNSNSALMRRALRSFGGEFRRTQRPPGWAERRTGVPIGEFQQPGSLLIYNTMAFSRSGLEAIPFDD
jgi:hypothetical protein